MRPTYDPNLTFLFLKADFPEAFFFEAPTFSVIGLSVEERLRVTGEELLRGGVFEKLAQRLKIRRSAPGEFPFAHGGAFGCLGYETVCDIEPRLKEVGVFQRLGNEVLAEIVFSKNLIVFDHQKGSVHFSLQDLELSEKDLVLSASMAPSAGSFVEPQDFSLCKAHLGKENFLTSVARIKEHIKAGDIFQAVLSERFELPTKKTGLEFFAKMRELCPSAYSFYFDFVETSFFGASPELLLQITQDRMETHPIAGTRPRGYSAAADARLEEELIANAKEGAEHLMLVDLARNDLGRVAAPGTVKVEAFRKLLKLPNVMHLISVVSGIKAREKTDLDALRSTFPAGTLSGAPKIRAMEILSELETRPRGFYGGAVVAFDFAGGLESCIAIRSLEVKEGKVILRAGAGIVADSDPESEYAEIQHKLNSLLQVIKATA